MATRKPSDSSISIIAADGWIVIRIKAPLKPLKVMLATVSSIVAIAMTLIQLVMKLSNLK